MNTESVKPFMPGPGPAAPSGARAQSALALPASPAPLFSFEGNPVGNVAPPDTEGAIGPNHYVQYVNVAVRVYDKTTHALIGTRFLLSSLFAQLGGLCSATDNGDPVVLYDQLADRWILYPVRLHGPARRPRSTSASRSPRRPIRPAPITCTTSRCPATSSPTIPSSGPGRTATT